MAATKRKLPVLPSPPAADQAEPRPPWHWVGFGTVAIFGAWMPLALLAQAIVSRLRGLPAGSPEEAAAAFYALPLGARVRVVLAMAGPHALALSLASFVGGYLVGRFGEPAGRREATLAGLMAGIVALVLAFAQGGISWPPFVVVVLATSFAAWGGARGRASVLRQP